MLSVVSRHSDHTGHCAGLYSILSSIIIYLFFISWISSISTVNGLQPQYGSDRCFCVFCKIKCASCCMQELHIMCSAYFHQWPSCTFTSPFLYAKICFWIFLHVCCVAFVVSLLQASFAAAIFPVFPFSVATTAYYCIQMHMAILLPFSPFIVLWHCRLGHLTRKNPSPIWHIMCLVGC